MDNSNQNSFILPSTDSSDTNVIPMPPSQNVVSDNKVNNVSPASQLAFSVAAEKPNVSLPKNNPIVEPITVELSKAELNTTEPIPVEPNKIELIETEPTIASETPKSVASPTEVNKSELTFNFPSPVNNSVKPSSKYSASKPAAESQLPLESTSTQPVASRKKFFILAGVLGVLVIAGLAFGLNSMGGFRNSANQSDLKSVSDKAKSGDNSTSEATPSDSSKSLTSSNEKDKSATVNGEAQSKNLKQTIQPGLEVFVDDNIKLNNQKIEMNSLRPLTFALSVEKVKVFNRAFFMKKTDYDNYINQKAQASSATTSDSTASEKSSEKIFIKDQADLPDQAVYFYKSDLTADVFSANTTENSTTTAASGVDSIALQELAQACETVQNPDNNQENPDQTDELFLQCDFSKFSDSTAAQVGTLAEEYIIVFEYTDQTIADLMQVTVLADTKKQDINNELKTQSDTNTQPKTKIKRKPGATTTEQNSF